MERREGGHSITEQSGRNEFRPAFKVSGGRHVWSGTEERGFLLVSRGAWALKSRWLNVSETPNWIFVGGLSLGCIFSEQKNPVERSRARRPRLVDYKPFKEISLHWHGPEDFFCGERTSSRGSNACQRCLRRAWLWRQPRTRTLEFETHDAPSVSPRWECLRCPRHRLSQPLDGEVHSANRVVASLSFPRLRSRPSMCEAGLSSLTNRSQID